MFKYKISQYLIIKKTKKILFRTLKVILALLLLLVFLLSLPMVQTKIAKSLTKSLNKKYNTNINIDRLGLNWWGQAQMKGVYIQDHHQDTLIYAQSISTNILSFKNMIEGNLNFGDVQFDKTKFYLTIYKDEIDDNLLVLIEKLEGEESSDDDYSPFLLGAENVGMSNSTVRIIDQNLNNPNLFYFEGFNLDASHFKIEGPNVSSQITTLKFITKRGIKVNNLSGDFLYSKAFIKLNGMHLKTDYSNIRGNMALLYDRDNGMSDFKNKVVFDMKFTNSIINTNDINAFYNAFGADIELDFSGYFKGALNNFTFSDALIKGFGGSIKGNFAFKNLLTKTQPYNLIAKSFILNSSYKSLVKLLPKLLGEVLPEELNNLEAFSLSGKSSLSPSILEADVSLASSLGMVETNMILSELDNDKVPAYQADMTLLNFDVGKLINSQDLGKVSTILNFKGAGFSKETLNTTIKGEISHFEFKDYRYTNIKGTGRLKSPQFNGNLIIDDPNLKMNFKGLVDVSNEISRYNFDTKIDYAELNKLKLVGRDSISIFTGRITMDAQGKTLDDVEGTLNFLETTYQNLNDDFYFDDFKITSEFLNDERHIKINSPDIINGKIKGKFKIEDIPGLFQNAFGSIYANYMPLELSPNQYIDYDFKVYNKIIDVFVPQIQLGTNTRIKGSVSSDTSKFKLNFKSPEIIAFGNYMQDVNLQIDNANPLFNTYINVSYIDNPYYEFSEFNLINKTLNDTLFIRSEFKGGKEGENIYNLSLYHTIDTDGNSVAGIKRSDIKFKDHIWYFNNKNDRRNKIIFDTKFNNIHIDGLVLNHKDEVIKLGGKITDSTYKDLSLQFKNVDLDKITPAVDNLTMGGNVNGQFIFLQQYGAYSNITIDQLIVNKKNFGNLNLNIFGNEALNKYSINTTLINKGLKHINAIGEIKVDGKSPTIDLNLSLKDIDLGVLSPFGGEEITDIKGFASGNVKIEGELNDPEVDGTLYLNDSGLSVPYLNIGYAFDDKTPVTVSKTKFAMFNAVLTDTKHQTKGILNGFIGHNNFSNWNLDLNIDTDRLLVLDTQEKEESLYYGTGFISGNAQLVGPFDEMVITANASTEEGTNFKILLSDTEDVGDDSYIHFISPEEKSASLAGETIVSEAIKGLELNFDLDINDKAEVEILVDKQNNSTLRGRGAGTLLIQINTLGKFKMWGDFVVIDGKYDFRYAGLIQKEIDVERNSYIAWDGDPLKAELRVTAKYNTNANPGPLLQNSTVSREIPVEVVVDLTGEITQPNLAFSINFPQVSSTVRSGLEYNLQTPQQRETQALFLISSNSFVNDVNVGQNALTGTLAQKVSSLISNMFADQDGKFKVAPYYSPGVRTTREQIGGKLGITLTAQISDRILINGKAGVPISGESNSAVTGDLEIQWLMNEDGTLRMQFFNRQNDIQFIGEEQAYEQGAGISFTIDFDDFRELVNKIFKTKINLEKED